MIPTEFDRKTVHDRNSFDGNSVFSWIPHSHPPIRLQLRRFQTRIDIVRSVCFLTHALWNPMPTEPSHSPIFRIREIFPTPKPGNWQKSYGSWNGLCQAVHISIGRQIGSGTLKLSRSYLKPTIRPIDFSTYSTTSNMKKEETSMCFFVSIPSRGGFSKPLSVTTSDAAQTSTASTQS